MFLLAVCVAPDTHKLASPPVDQLAHEFALLGREGFAHRHHTARCSSRQMGQRYSPSMTRALIVWPWTMVLIHAAIV